MAPAKAAKEAPPPEPEEQPEDTEPAPPIDRVRAELTWRHLSEEQQKEYYALAGDAEAAGELLATSLHLPEYKFDPREAVRVDYATHVLNYGKKIGLSPVKISVLFSISQSLLEVAVSGGEKTKAAENLKNFMIGLCAANPTPEDYKLSPDHIGHISKFFADHFLQHFKAFYFVFNNEQPRQETDISLLVETVHLRQDFHEAYIEEEWKAYNDDLAAKAEEERVAAEEARVAEEEKAKKVAEEQAVVAAETARREEMAKVPQSLDDAVNRLVALRLTEEKQKMEMSYKEREAKLTQRIATLEEAAAAAAPAVKKPPGKK